MVIVSAEPLCAEDGLRVALRVIVLQAIWTFVTLAVAVPLPLVTAQVCAGLEGCVRTVTL